MPWQYQFELLTRPYGGVSEGPVWDGDAILFTHIPTSRIMRYAPDSGVITEARSGTNHTNGLAFDSRGNLFGCCSGGRAIVRFDDDAIVSRGRPSGRAAAEHAQRPGHRPQRAHLVHQPLERRQHRPQRSGGTGQPLGAAGRPPGRRQLYGYPGYLRHHHAQRHPGLSDQRTLYVAESNSDRIDLNRGVAGLPD